MRRCSPLLKLVLDGKTAALPKIAETGQMLHLSSPPEQWMQLFAGSHLKLRSSNRSYRASSIQWKRDWHQAAYLLEMYDMQREGMLDLAELDKKYMTRYASTWTNVRKNLLREAHKRVLHQVRESLWATKDGRLEEHMQCSLEVRQSSLGEGNQSFSHGQGLFVRSGTVEPGTVVGLVPGMWWMKSDLSQRRWEGDSEGNRNGCSPYQHSRRQFLDGAVLDADLDLYPGHIVESSDAELRDAMTAFYSSCAEFLTTYQAPEGASRVQTLFMGTYLPALRHMLNRWTFRRDNWPHVPLREWAVRNSAHTILGKQGLHDFSKGGFINHCGTRESNVLLMPCSFPATFPPELIPYLPYGVDYKPPFGAQYIKTKRQQHDITWNHVYFGKPNETEVSQGVGSQFLLMVPGLVAVATRPIRENEEILTNLRLRPNLAMRQHHPLWYRMSPEGVTEDWMGNNMFHPRSSFLLRLLGLYDPRTTLGEALRNPELFDNDLIARVLHRLGRV